MTTRAEQQDMKATRYFAEGCPSRKRHLGMDRRRLTGPSCRSPVATDHVAFCSGGRIATRGGFLNLIRAAPCSEARGILLHPSAGRDTCPRRPAQGDP